MTYIGEFVFGLLIKKRKFKNYLFMLELTKMKTDFKIND